MAVPNTRAPARKRPPRRSGNPNKVRRAAPAQAARPAPAPPAPVPEKPKAPARRRPALRTRKVKDVPSEAEKAAKKLDDLAAPKPKKLEDDGETHLEEMRKVLKQEVKKKEESASVPELPKKRRGRPRKNPEPM